VRKEGKKEGRKERRKIPGQLALGFYVDAHKVESEDLRGDHIRHGQRIVQRRRLEPGGRGSK